MTERVYLRKGRSTDRKEREELTPSRDRYHLRATLLDFVQMTRIVENVTHYMTLLDVPARRDR